MLDGAVTHDKQQHNGHCGNRSSRSYTSAPHPKRMASGDFPIHAPRSDELIDLLPQSFRCSLLMTLHAIAQIILPLIVHSAFFLTGTTLSLSPVYPWPCAIVKRNCFLLCAVWKQSLCDFSPRIHRG